MTSTTPRRLNTLRIPVLVIGSATRADASHEIILDEAFEPVGLTADINVRN